MRKDRKMNKEKVSTTQISVTESALHQIRKIKEESNIPAEYFLRVSVKGGGCSGFTYSLGFDGETDTSDTIIDYNDLKIAVDGKSLFYLSGTELDYSDGLNGKGFTFNNPNASKTCGCGESFAV
jgi:iron-sulfur cluster assembly protein